MKALKLIATAGVLTAGLLPTLSARAADTVVFGAAGSSALFNVFAQGASTASGASNNYSAKNAAVVHDTSSASIPDQTGNLWVVWDGAPSGSRKIWFYLSVDSTVGVRSYFNSAALSFTTLPAAGNIVPNLPPDSTVPADVQTAIKNFVFNAAATDITAPDAEQATSDAQTLGYSLTNPIKGDGGQVVPVSFSLTARTYVQTSIGADPVLVFVNKSNTAAGHLGASTVTNIDRFTLAGFLNGTFRRTSDIDTSIAAGGGPVVTFFREPISGTYQTTEKTIPASVEAATTQEKNISATTNNPANTTTPAWTSTSPIVTTGGRVRAIGTGQLVKDVNLTLDGLGYAFWSTGNFSSTNAGSTKYLTVDGADPLLDSYSAGAYPAGSSVTFRNVKNGGYPIWSKLRVLTPTTPAGDIATLIADVLATDSGGDFVPATSLKVFRSHFATGGVTTPHNGNTAAAEAGGDAGGAVFPINADKDYYTDTGLELVGSKQ
ncbi:hypothetical protein [Capsulimonas corticalis]|nr:hypothetical protein [Capsulimonas corticalis]